jgi:mono/diheme cytochrome c family protein
MRGLCVAVRVMSRLLPTLLAASALLSGATAQEQVRFNEHIRPILSNNCFYCHGPDEKHRKADLRLDVREGAVADLGGYAAIAPGKPDASELLRRVTAHDPDDLMPPPKSKKPRLSEKEVALVRKWIEQGAEYEGHWAFLPLAKVAPPDAAALVKARPELFEATVRGLMSVVPNPIDGFILKRQLDAGIVLSPRADAATLCRRIYLDLTGLLPAPEEVAAFTEAAARDHPAAVAKLADKLLASPHYGERWGRHWLDQARYADSNGYAIDGARTMWPYRDWVIASLNADMPFDRFTIEQLAGDLLPDPTKAQRVATAFHRNTLINEEGGSDPEQFRVEACIDRVNTTGAVWLGLTVGCAQCHTHKFDPITQREFYQLFAFFNSGEDRNNKGATVVVTRGEMFGGPPVETPDAVPSGEIERLREAWEKAEIARQQAAGPKANARLLAALLQLDAARSGEGRKLVAAAFERAVPKAKKQRIRNDDLDAQTVEVMVMRDLAEKRPTFLFQRGDFTRPDKAIGELRPGVIAAVSGNSGLGAGLQDSKFASRLDLARWLVSPENPLTPRVTMNRMWMRYFGRGLVETEEDFGTQGSPPTHPELLDWLAGEFIRRGWSMKAMHRLIVASATYQQSSAARPDLAEKDPRNLLLARQERLRVEAEIIRDAALCASGQLDRTIGGPGARPPQPEGMYAFTQTAKAWKASEGPARFRRGMYTIFYRSAPHPLLGTFDVPDMQTTCTRRIRSNTPLQSLTLANDEGFIEIARGLAGRLAREAAGLDARLLRGYNLTLNRAPSGTEFAILRDYSLGQQRHFESDPTAAKALLAGALADLPPAEAAALVLAARALLNTDAFITRE